MIISRSADAIAFSAPSFVAHAAILARAAGRRAAAAIASWKHSRTARSLVPVPLDSRTLRDIGLTPMGISEEALAALNEARCRAGGRA